jgi:GDP-D-mannose dehydratase
MIAIAAESVSKRFRRQTVQPPTTLGLIPRHEYSDDYVTATGEPHSVEKLAEIALT